MVWMALTIPHNYHWNSVCSLWVHKRGNTHRNRERYGFGFGQLELAMVLVMLNRQRSLKIFSGSSSALRSFLEVHNSLLTQTCFFIFFFLADYVGFIKKIMKLMQHNYQTILKLEVELKQLQEAPDVPSRPRKYLIFSCGRLNHFFITIAFVYYSSTRLSSYTTQTFFVFSRFDYKTK